MLRAVLGVADLLLLASAPGILAARAIQHAAEAHRRASIIEYFEVDTLDQVRNDVARLGVETHVRFPLREVLRAELQADALAFRMDVVSHIQDDHGRTDRAGLLLARELEREMSITALDCARIGAELFPVDQEFDLEFEAADLPPRAVLDFGIDVYLFVEIVSQLI